MRPLYEGLESRLLLSAAHGAALHKAAALAAPTKLAALVVAFNEISLTWKPPTGTAVGFEIEQRATRGKSIGGWQVIGQVDPATAQYLDTSVTASTKYNYRLRAVGASGDSKYTRVTTAITKAPDPKAPSDVTATPSPDGAVDLSWANSALANTGLQVSRSRDGRNFTPVATLDPGSTSYTDPALDPSTLYYYRVRSRLGTRFSSPGNVAFATTVPAAPTNASAQALSSGQIQLTWTGSAGATSYTIQRSTDASTYAPVSTLPGTLPVYAYIDSNLSAATKYYYRVTAANAGGNSTPATASATTNALLPVSNLAATASSAYQTLLTWSSGGALGAQQLLVLRSTDGVNFTTLASLDTSATAYIDPNTAASTAYTYKIAAQDNLGASVLSAPATLTTPAVLTPGTRFVSTTETGSTSANNAGIVPGGTAVTVANVTGFAPGQTIVLENENVVIQSISGNTLTLASPGAVGTHYPGFNVYLPSTPDPAITHSVAGQVSYNEMAIANWDVVPYQTLDTPFNLGVVAFHANGIKTVTFSVNGGPWKSVSAMTANPQTANTSGVGQATNGIVEYWLTLDPSLFPSDGPIEVRAVAYPNNGVPRALAPLYLNVNAHHTLNPLSLYVSPAGSDSTGDGSAAKPFATIQRAANYWMYKNSSTTPIDGSTIYLQPGNYQLTSTAYYFPNTSTGWLNIQPVPGVDRSQVVISGWGDPNTDQGWGLRTKLMHFSNITFAPQNATNQSIFRTTTGTQSSLWLDQCVLTGPGAAVDAGWTSNNFVAIYITNTSQSECRDSLGGTLIRSVSVYHIGSDAFSNSRTVINSSAIATGFGLDPATDTFHADIYQFYNPGNTTQNVILYGVTADVGGMTGGQGFFAGAGESLKDIAFVNCTVTNQDPNYGGTNTAPVFQFGGPTQNLYILNCSVTGLSFWRTDFSFVATDVVVDTSTFSSPINPTPLTGVTIR